jgi:TRAP-type mannitol/chloroaromatic compound transport system permease small subunit
MILVMAVLLILQGVSIIIRQILSLSGTIDPSEPAKVEL